MNQLENQKPEAAESRVDVQTLRMENDAHVVGPDAPIANGIGQFWFARDSGVPENGFTRADLSLLIPLPDLVTSEFAANSPALKSRARHFSSH